MEGSSKKRHATIRQKAQLRTMLFIWVERRKNKICVTDVTKKHFKPTISSLSIEFKGCRKAEH